jgi:hypothetical protein
MAKSFADWFNKEFKSEVPEAFAQYLAQHPKGARNGFGPCLWTAENVIAETEDRDLIEKGICLIGASDSISHILMRAKDGKIFIVDSRDHQSVDATFCDVQVLINLLNLE